MVNLRLGDAVIVYYEWLINYQGGFVCIGLICICGAMAAAAYNTSHYSIRESGDDLILSLQYGMFVKGGPNDSYFSICSDTRLVSLIADCDYSRSIPDVLCGMGTVFIKSANEGDVRIPYVQDPDGVTKYLMSKSKVPDARILSTV
jgi:hypothetical protein